MVLSSTKRYEKHTRYLAELDRVPEALRKYGELAAKYLVQILKGEVAFDAFRSYRDELDYITKRGLVPARSSKGK